MPLKARSTPDRTPKPAKLGPDRVRSHNAAVTESPAPTSHRNALIAFVLLTLAVAGAIAPDAIASILYRLIVDGIVLAFWFAGLIGVGRLIRTQLAPRAFDKPEDAVGRFVIDVALGFGSISIIVLLSGWIGVLNRLSAVALLAAGATIFTRHVHLRRDSIRETFRRPAGVGFLFLLLAPFVAITVAGDSVLPGILWGDEPHGYDVVSYHLQIPREWFAAGRISPLTHNVFSYFPLGVEMHYLLALHLRGDSFAGMYLAQFMHGTITLITPLAVYAFVRPRSKTAAAVCAIVCGATPFLPMLGAVAYNDGGLIFLTFVSILILLRATTREELILAGLVGGFAAGCKYTGVVAAIALPAVALVLAAPSRDAFKRAFVFAIVAVAAFSPWAVRNLVWAGNPVFPIAAGTLGQAHFDAGQVERFDAAHSPTTEEKPPDVRVGRFVSRVILEWRFGLAPLTFLAILAAVVIDRRNALTRALAIYLVLLAVFWIAWTHLQSRFFTPAIPVAAALLAPLAARRFGFVVAIAGALLGLINFDFDAKSLSSQLISRLGKTEPLLFSLDTPADLLPGFVGESNARLIESSPAPLVLVGDAKAFWFAIDSRRLRYRTVFDVPSRPVDSTNLDDSLSAWAGPIEPGSIVLVNPSELMRLGATYRNLPDATPLTAGRDQVYLFIRP